MPPDPPTTLRQKGARSFLNSWNFARTKSRGFGLLWMLSWAPPRPPAPLRRRCQGVRRRGGGATRMMWRHADLATLPRPCAALARPKRLRGRLKNGRRPQLRRNTCTSASERKRLERRLGLHLRAHVLPHTRRKGSRALCSLLALTLARARSVSSPPTPGCERSRVNDAWAPNAHKGLRTTQRHNRPSTRARIPDGSQQATLTRQGLDTRIHHSASRGHH